MDYTHKALIEAGYTRHAPDPYRGVGFVTYERHRFDDQVVFVGDTARMEKWTEAHWKQRYPKVYAWYIDPKRRDPYSWPTADEWPGLHGQIAFVFIKGEDPKLVEESQHGSKSSKSVV